MPVATTDGTYTERFDLKTLPPRDGEEGGWVEIRRMQYGEYLKRREMGSDLVLHNEKGSKDMKSTMQLFRTGIVQWEFAHCVTNHNLTDAEGKPLDFRNAMTIHTLDPRVGEEISTLIGKVNNFEEDDEKGNLLVD